MTAIHRTIAVALLLLVNGGAAVAQRQPEPLAAAKVRLLVVLRKPGARRDSPKIVKEPDFDKIGGNVISRHDGVIEIELPLAATKHLIDDDNVAYVQRVWMGEPLDDWSAPTATATSSKLHARTLETGSNLSWASGAFLYDGSGNIKKIGDDDYVYDSALRLIQSVVHGTTETYKYDSFGNLKEKTLAGAAPGVIPVDPGSNRISGVSYDAIGDQLNDGSGGQARYVYDAMGMMTGVMGTTGSYERRMIYTADDERIGTAIDSNLTRWRFRDFNTNQVLREWSSSYNMSWDWVEDFVYADGKLVAGETVDYQGGRRHFSLDHLGNVRMITGQSGLAYGRHDYYPFGVEQTSSIQTYVNFNYSPPEPMKFAGHERDFLGLWGTENTDYLDDMHARYYNPNVGRFLSVDPVLDQKFGIPHPQAWNRYYYVRNNPLKLVDPTGKNAVVTCDTRQNCTVSVQAQIALDLHDKQQVAAANSFAAGATAYWNKQQAKGPHGENLTFNVQFTIVQKGTEKAGMDTLNVVSGAGRSKVDMSLDIGIFGPLTPDRGTIYTQDTTNNPTGMAGVSAHETGHLMGLRDLYPASGVPQFIGGPQHSIMEMAQPDNSADYAWWVLYHGNGNTIFINVP